MQEEEEERESHEERDKQQERWTVRYSIGDRCIERETDRENIEIWEVASSIRLAGHQSSSGFRSQTGGKKEL